MWYASAGPVASESWNSSVCPCRLFNDSNLLANCNNSASNATDRSLSALGMRSSHLATKLLLSFILSAMIAASLFGNSLVVIAIVKERHLQTVANYLIMSLAIADLMVAMLVMPLSLYNELNEGVWVLGEPLCGLWIGFDVLCCTASILHLVAIAIDRYWSVTDINYATHKGTRRVVTMIAAIWLTSISISIPGHYGWPNPHGALIVDDQCLINQEYVSCSKPCVNDGAHQVPTHQ